MSARKMPDVDAMTRDELTTFAVKLWEAADTWHGGILLGAVVKGDMASTLEWRNRIVQLERAMQ